MKTTNTATLSMTVSFRQRALAAAASLLITLAVIAGNLQLAQGYAHAIPVVTDTAQLAQSARG